MKNANIEMSAIILIKNWTVFQQPSFLSLFTVALEEVMEKNYLHYLYEYISPFIWISIIWFLFPLLSFKIYLEYLKLQEGDKKQVRKCQVS